MNWYVLYTISYKAKQLVLKLNEYQDIEAFIPYQEFYHRKTKEHLIKPMFPGYIFIKSRLEQSEFNILLTEIMQKQNKMIKQLKNDGVSALRKEEIWMLETLLNPSNIVEMSTARLENGKAIITNGPLKKFENRIVKVDKRNQYAYLDLIFMERYIKVGLNITSKN